MLKDAVLPSSAPALTLPLNGRLFMDNSFALRLTSNLQAIKNRQLCAFICGLPDQTKKGRSGTFLMLKTLIDENACSRLTVSKTMPQTTSQQAEVRFYENV